MAIDSDHTHAAEPELREKLGRLLNSQFLAALASEGEGQPYLNLVAFAVDGSLREIYFPTPRSTRKYANLSRNPRAALMVDNRTEMAADLSSGMAATALGRVEELGGEKLSEAGRLYLSRNSGVGDLLAQDDTALLSLKVERYICVLGVSRVVTLKME